MQRAYDGINLIIEEEKISPGEAFKRESTGSVSQYDGHLVEKRYAVIFRLISGIRKVWEPF